MVAFKPLPYSRSSPDVWHFPGTTTSLGALPSHWPWRGVGYREGARRKEARMGVFWNLQAKILSWFYFIKPAPNDTGSGRLSLMGTTGIIS